MQNDEILDDVLHHRQHGFIELPFQTQPFATYHDLVRAADKGHTTHTIIMNFEKTFDKVLHRLLLKTVKNTWNKRPSS